MIRNTKLQYSTTACLLAILCYGLPFQDNALGGLCKTQNQLVMAKKSNGGGQPPKKKSRKVMKPVSTLKREVTTYSKGSDGSTRTKYPKRVSSSGASSQLTRITTPVKKKKGL